MKLSSVARSQRPSRLWLVARLIWRAMTNLGTLRRGHPVSQRAVVYRCRPGQPEVSLQIPYDSYLVNGLSIKDRADCFSIT